MTVTDQLRQLGDETLETWGPYPWTDDGALKSFVNVPVPLWKQLVAVVETGDELRLWEPGRRGWAAVFARFTDALAALARAVEEHTKP